MRVSCPNCQQGVNAPEEYAGKRAKCPKCKVAFVIPSLEQSPMKPVVAVPPSPPEVSNLPNGPEHERDWLERFLLFYYVSTPAVFAVVFLSMFVMPAPVFFALGTLLLLASMLLLLHYTRMKATIKRGKEQAEFLEFSLSTRAVELEKAVEKYSTFRDHFDSICNKEKERLKKEHSQAQEMFDFAKNRNATIDRLGKKLLSDTEKWVFSRMTPNNFTTSSEKLR